MRHYSVPVPSSSTGPKDTHNSTLGQRTQGDLIQLLARIDKYTAQLIISEKARITTQCQALPTAQSADSVAAFAKKTPEGGAHQRPEAVTERGRRYRGLVYFIVKQAGSPHTNPKTKLEVIKFLSFLL